MVSDFSVIYHTYKSSVFLMCKFKIVFEACGHNGQNKVGISYIPMLYRDEKKGNRIKESCNARPLG